MKVLVIGSGGREHALTWKLSQSPKLDKIYCTPGNGGISRIAETFASDPCDLAAISEIAVKKKIDLVVIGPEAPLVAGTGNALRASGIPVFGPDAQGAELEGSKAFAKEVMTASGVPTAGYRMFTELEPALDHMREVGVPAVIKADGLAAGKGVTVAETQEEAEQAIRECLEQNKFGSAGTKIIIEEILKGDELSLISISDGQKLFPFLPAQDFKRIGDNDSGPNTGGMGSYAPYPGISETEIKKLADLTSAPVIQELTNRNIDFRGTLYAGLMLTGQGPEVLEYNVRFGDPETQAILPLLESDLLDHFNEAANGDLQTPPAYSGNACVTVVMASGGYPGDFTTGHPISGLEEAERLDGVVVFHAGTTFEEGRFFTSGGRVLNVTATGATLAEARERAYTACSLIDFQNKYYRKDIALKAAGK